jgi:hypothetical protein
MFSRQAFLTGLLIISTLCLNLTALADSLRDHNDNDGDVGFMLELAFSPRMVDRLMEDLKKLGAQATRFADPPSRIGSRILVGPFNSADAATRYGDSLLARGMIDAFTVRAPRDSTAADLVPAVPFGVAGGGADVVPSVAPDGPPFLGKRGVLTSLVALAPAFDPALTADPVKAALEDIVGVTSERNGGLWLAGDIREGVSRLQWIAGPENVDLLSVARDGKVTLRRDLLIRYSGADAAKAGARFVLFDYMTSHEGLHLLAQLIEAENRYCLYMSHGVPTAGGEIEVQGAINLDNNFDSRINTYRKNGMKLPRERPPEEFDSLVGINPGAHWFNLRVNRIVSDGIIVFHELAEALAKVDFGLDYLPQGLQPGAHDTAVQREMKLQAQRRDSDTVTTLGSNAVFTDWDTFLKFKAEQGVKAHVRGR